MGLSQAERNMLGVLAQVAGIGIKVRETYTSKTAVSIVDELIDSVGTALNIICPQLTRQEAMAMEHIMAAYQSMAIPEFGNAVTLINMGMGMLSDVLDKVKNPQRKEALELVWSRLTRAQRYWDRKGDRVEEYDLACDAADKWNAIMEGALECPRS